MTRGAETPVPYTKVDRLRMSSSIRGVLLPSALIFYDGLTPQEQLRYEEALDEVTRMEGIREQGFVPEDFYETDRHHVREACKMAVEYSAIHPNLAKEVDFGVVQKMLLVHDVGEIHPAIGDVQPPPDRTPEEERRKQLEPYAAVRILRKISNEATRNEAISLYLRYQADDFSDATVQMARFIDKAQGTSRVADTVFVANIAKREGKLKQMIGHLSITAGQRMLQSAMNLVGSVQNPIAKDEAKSLVNNEFGLIVRAGHPQIAKPCQEAIKSIT